MKTTISKAFTFDAAHRLPHVPEGHKCGRMHGHTYRLTVSLSGPVIEDGPEAGMVYEYGALADLVRPIVEELDHHTLNEIQGLANPTTEVLAAWVYGRLAHAFPARFELAIEVAESVTTTCRVTA